MIIVYHNFFLWYSAERKFMKQFQISIDQGSSKNIFYIYPQRGFSNELSNKKLMKKFVFSKHRL